MNNKAQTGQIFFYEVQAKFNLREPKSNKPTNIYLVCRIDRKQIRLSTGVKVYPEHWNVKKQEAYISCRLSELDNLNNTIVNTKIIEIKNRFLQYKRYLCDNPNEIGNSVKILKKFIYKDTMEKEKQNINAVHWLRNTLALDRTIKDSTRADYVKQIKFFEAFLNEVGKYPISFSDINLPLIKDYESYLFNKEVGKGKTTKTTTVGNKVEKIICILKRAEQQGMIDIHESKLDKYKKPQSRQGDENEIYLTEDEIDKIYALRLTGREEEVRDLFVLQCWIGQRFSDTQAINEGIIKEAPNGKGKVIEIVQEKKTHRVSIPLLPVAIDILNKYKNGFPIYTNQTALNYLKNIGEKAGITRLHNVTEDRGGEVVTTQVKAYELIGTHTARRSFICNMLKHGYDSHIIMKITGHNDAKSFKKYVRLTSEDAALLMLETESTKVRQSDKVPTTISQEGNKEAINILKQYQNTINGITFDTLLDTQFFASKINKAAELQSQVGHLKNGKLCSYDNEITSLISEIEKFSQSSTSDSDVAKQYVKQLSVGKQSDLHDSFREMIIECVKIGISKDAIMQFVNKALEISLLDKERFTNIKEITQPYWIKGIRADKLFRKSRLLVSLNIIFSPNSYGCKEVW